MRKVKTDNSDLIEYVNTVKELKNHISIEEYRNEYRRLRFDDIPLILETPDEERWADEIKLLYSLADNK